MSSHVSLFMLGLPELGEGPRVGHMAAHHHVRPLAPHIDWRTVPPSTRLAGRTRSSLRSASRLATRELPHIQLDRRTIADRNEPRTRPPLRAFRKKSRNVVKFDVAGQHECVHATCANEAVCRRLSWCRHPESFDQAIPFTGLCAATERAGKTLPGHPTTTAASDIEPVMRSRQEPGAFSLLFGRYHREIFLYCLRRLANPADADDAASTIFLKAHA